MGLRIPNPSPQGGIPANSLASELSSENATAPEGPAASPKAQEQKQFEEDKPVILSRLMQFGYSKTEAEDLISGAASPEEIILALMEKKDFTYGEAVDVVRTSEST